MVLDTTSTASTISKKSAAISTKSGMESSLSDEKKRTKQKRNLSGGGVVSSVEPNNPSSPRGCAYFEDSGTFHLNLVFLFLVVVVSIIFVISIP